MREFDASCYKDMESLFRDKANYYQSLFNLLINQLVDEEVYMYDESEDNFVHRFTGFHVDELIGTV